MLLTLAHIGARSNPSNSSLKSRYDALVTLYLDRIQPYFSCHPHAFPTESAFLDWLARPKSPGAHSKSPAVPVLLDRRGRRFTSEEFAAWLAARRDQATPHIVLAIGPADGWNGSTFDSLGLGEPARARAGQPQGLLLSLGSMTLAHDLARLVLAEQLYRACAILANHPYHSGH
jgi:23S rRNA (pseudouridine1915-N3)-methyltransferase